MGLLSFLKKDNHSSSAVSTSLIKGLPHVNEDIKNLLWIENGPHRNYKNTPTGVHKSVYDHFTLTVSFYGPNEPSAIDTKSVVREPINPYNVPRPPYYPSYGELTPEQKWLYWDFLSKPYSGSHDIGYVFIYYYGLERHLFTGNFSEAFDVILKLRDTYSNKSFQKYSASALALSCMIHRDAEYAFKFLNSLDKEYEFYFDAHLYFLCKAAFNSPITVIDLIRYRKGLNFTNDRYIKSEYDLFVTTLNLNIQKRFNSDNFLISDILNEQENVFLKQIKIRVFENISIHDQFVEIPDYIDSEFGTIALSLLKETHEDVKKILAKRRKENAKS